MTKKDILAHIAETNKQTLFTTTKTIKKKVQKKTCLWKYNELECIYVAGCVNEQTGKINEFPTLSTCSILGLNFCGFCGKAIEEKVNGNK